MTKNNDAQKRVLPEFCRLCYKVAVQYKLSASRWRRYECCYFIYNQKNEYDLLILHPITPVKNYG